MLFLQARQSGCDAFERGSAFRKALLRLRRKPGGAWRRWNLKQRCVGGVGKMDSEIKELLSGHQSRSCRINSRSSKRASSSGLRWCPPN